MRPVQSRRTLKPADFLPHKSENRHTLSQGTKKTAGAHPPPAAFLLQIIKSKENNSEDTCRNQVAGEPAELSLVDELHQELEGEQA